jgi:enoyl-CoA hydratase
MTTDPEILFDVRNGIGVMTLNRPKALNALSLGMIREMERVMPAWERDPAVKAVVVRGAGDRAFCAGGDVAGLYREMREDAAGTLRRDFFREEYIVNRRIYRYAKPWISFLHGIDMGGGVGLSVHGTYSIATERFLFAMPETAIGLFPDVGGGYFLVRLKGALGLFLALSGHRLKAADALYAGIVQAHVPSARLDEVLAALGAADLSGPDARRAVDAVVSPFKTDPGAPTLPALMPVIDSCFSADTVEEMVARLRRLGSDFAAGQLKELGRMSPIAMKVTLEQLKRSANRSFEDTMTMEYRISQACMRDGHDFFEGVRAVLIDKDQAPKWNPPTLEGVTDAMVAEHFVPVANDLVFA